MDDQRIIAEQLNKIVWDKHIDSYSLAQLLKKGYIKKITFSQYVITEKGFILMNNYNNLN